ncbi:MAG: type II toxin-antitoxin system Phd/YefM family antitoxin [Deltaproteobacteria bacterium]|nr:type II toxin-antitoxin system Phd/YefM family antitoxin [Deltaproteobacteria bacterium]
MDEISAFEAKTLLSELLGEAEHGRSFVICRRGRAVARLVPPEQNKENRQWREVIKSLRDLRERIAKKSGQINVRKLIEEGQRF